MRIRELFMKAREQHRTLFIPYITCGDPTLQVTAELVVQLANIGADIVELGVPFSDPLADGPTNQLAAMRALKNHVSLRDCCAVVKQIRAKRCAVPIVLFTYLNPIYRLGVSTFAQLARDSGVDAVLIVDMPLEELEEMASELTRYAIGVVLLIAPTTSVDRLIKSSEASPEFLYYVSRTGVTGAEVAVSANLAAELNQVKQHTSLPIAVGFGISTPSQASMVAALADGVIVGSVLVNQLDTNDVTAGQDKLLQLAVQLNNAVKMNEEKM